MRPCLILPLQFEIALKSAAIVQLLLFLKMNIENIWTAITIYVLKDSVFRERTISISTLKKTLKHFILNSLRRTELIPSKIH